MVKIVLQEEMQTAVNLSVPLDAEISVGERWFDAK
jgi:DNA polymerase I-like protein with 3'-5' exonuclease and polymerase domains